MEWGIVGELGRRRCGQLGGLLGILAVVVVVQWSPAQAALVRIQERIQPDSLAAKRAIEGRRTRAAGVDGEHPGTPPASDRDEGWESGEGMVRDVDDDQTVVIINASDITMGCECSICVEHVRDCPRNNDRHDACRISIASWVPCLCEGDLEVTTITKPVSWSLPATKTLFETPAPAGDGQILAK